MKPQFKQNNFYTSQFYKNNIRNNNINVDFKPDTYTTNAKYIKVRNNLDNQYSHTTSGTTNSVGSKQNPSFRGEIDINMTNSNRHYWNCINRRPDGTCEKGGIDASNVDDWFDSLDGENVLPQDYPPLQNEIFVNGLETCKHTSELQTPHEITLPPHIPNQKPKYGTLLGLDVVGPRKLSENLVNINSQKPFDAFHSGYQIKNKTIVTNEEKQKYKKVPAPTPAPTQNETYKIPKLGNQQFEQQVENSPSQPSPTLASYSDFKKVQKENKYKNNKQVYDAPCGSKNLKGTILEANRDKPHINYFIKHNIIGIPTENTNSSQIMFRNSGKFGHDTLTKDDISLNKLKTFSHDNFINNTNSYRTEVNKKFFEQKTDRIVRNLTYRG